MNHESESFPSQTHLAAARLLVEVAPAIFESQSFALKGGAAINLFLRELPRLSVDLDLAFTNHQLSREEALKTTSINLRQAKDRLIANGLKVQTIDAHGSEAKLVIWRDQVSVKIEVNTVIRGSLRPARKMSLTAAASDILMADLELPVLSPEDIYGGKLVAAMDRQHPRDIFDIRELFVHGGITPEIRRAFVVYLASHNRPVHEVLFPKPKDIALDFEATFTGLTINPVTLEELYDTRRRLFQELPVSLEHNEREFLITLSRGEPIWSLLGIPHLEQLPAIRWKLENLRRLAKTNPKKLQKFVKALSEGLDSL